MVLDRLDFDLFRIKTQLLQAPDDFVAIALVAAVAHQNRVEGAVRCIPIAFGVVPARFAEQADGCERNGDDINIRRLDACLFEAELR